MGYTCCIPECNTGYRSNKNTEEKIPLFRFPSDLEYQKIWLRAIPRYFTLTGSHRVCAKHFQDSDFISSSVDTNKRRQRNRGPQELQQLRLKSTAIPSIFPHLPQYLSKQKINERSISATSESRRRNDNINIQAVNEQAMLEDCFHDLNSLKCKLSAATLPSGFIIRILENSVEFHYIVSSDVCNIPPKLAASVVIRDSLIINMYVASVPISQDVFQHLLETNIVCSMVQICNILAFCKSLCNTSPPLQTSVEKSNCIKLAVSALDQFVVRVEQENEDENASRLSLLKFLSEQLKLIFVDKMGRRYSNNLLTLSLLWKLTSTALFKKLRNIFVLPSIKRLQQVCSDCEVECRTVDVNYLKQRTANYSPAEKTVTLLIDEVYTAQRVEYSKRSFTGLTEEGSVAKTVLAFMVQSICTNYKDVVCLVPIEKLDTRLLRSWFEMVMVALDEVFFVVAVSVDNHVCNRKLFMDLCDESRCLLTSIPHPIRATERLFLLFDITHNFKNIFNNFVNKKRFHIPKTTESQRIFEEDCIADFAHIKRLYALEEHKPLKIAHALKKASLNPSNIARTSPQHALSIFNDSTARALEMYADENPQFINTSKFVKFICNIWKILSVKTPYKGIAKKDEMCRPITFNDNHDEHALNTQYLASAKEIFMQWKRSGNTGLTSQTFLACIQTMSAVPELALYLRKKYGFSYILPGKFSSDPIEGRFGWYRQVNGGNFFMSLKQVLEAEKKIRTISLIQQHGLISASKLKHLDAVPISTENVVGSTTSTISWLEDFFSSVWLEELQESDANIAYFVSGYIGRSISRRRKCGHCKALLVKSLDAPPIPKCESNDHTKLFEMADRGGLSEPTQFCFAITGLAVQFYGMLLADDLAKDRLFTSMNQRSTFVAAVKRSVSVMSKGIVDQECAAGHHNFELIVQTCFNCFAKNELKRFNAPRLEEPDNKVRKLRKLNSSCSKST